MRRYLDSTIHSSSLGRRLRQLNVFERCEEAVAFIREFAREHDLPSFETKRRIRQVRAEILRHGYYEHSQEELAYGARAAWRNHSRCIGRLFWESLSVVDCRSISATDTIADRMFEHMSEAKRDGAIRSIISVFPAVKDRKAELPAYIESKQIIQYAGYLTSAGTTMGDSANVEVTRMAMSLGWKPSSGPGRFDRLPLLMRGRGRREIYEVPDSAVQEVRIEHQSNVALSALGLRWYSVPCVSSMILTIGGIDYPCAPFNGHYMVTEIANRNLADERRYNLLEAAGRSLGFDLSEPYWKDRTLTELNTAVRYSFRRDGITIVDQHEASKQYLQFIQRENAAGRAPSGDWSWLVSPQASSADSIFHLPMADRRLVPNYYDSRTTDGEALAPSYDDEIRSRGRRRWDRLRRRYYDWRRARR